MASIEADDLPLSVQVLQEFDVQAARTTRINPIAHDIAAGLVHTWLRFTVQEITPAVMLRALELTAAQRMSY